MTRSQHQRFTYRYVVVARMRSSRGLDEVVAHCERFADAVLVADEAQPRYDARSPDAFLVGVWGPEPDGRDVHDLCLYVPISADDGQRGGPRRHDVRLLTDRNGR